MSLGTIQSIQEVNETTLSPVAPLDGRGGQLGFSGLLSAVTGRVHMDGYSVVTDQHTYHVLIDNSPSCCESFGYFASEDDLAQFVGAELREVRLTDTALKTAAVEASGWYDGDDGGIQFVDFATDRGTFQLAVYNAHNGYYGHGVLVLRDEDVLLSDTL